MKQLPSETVVWLFVLGLALGCSSETAPQPIPKTEHAEHSSGAGDPHAGHNMSAGRSMLMVETDPPKAAPGEVATLRLMIHSAGGDAVRTFEPIHEKLVHLIIVREGLDHFAHLHPTLDDQGNMTAEYAFPVAGAYHLFADHKPAGEKQALAVARLNIAGDAATAEPLVPNAPGRIAADQLHTDVAIADAKSGVETKIAFTLHDEQDAPIADLQPYLGAMGHLVIISADAREYVHAHPAESSSNAATDGRVEFEAHFAKPGIYKAWGQFQRDGKILTVPFVLKVD